MYRRNYNCNCNYCNSNCKNNNSNNKCTCNYYCKKKNALDSLYEVEHFLCNFRNICKAFNLYKIIK